MNRIYLLFVASGLILSSVPGRSSNKTVPALFYDLVFNGPVNARDETIPLGNGILSAVVWQKEETLRFLLDRDDLWDPCPIENISRPELSISRELTGFCSFSSVFSGMEGQQPVGKWISDQLKKQSYKRSTSLHRECWAKFGESLSSLRSLKNRTI